MGQTQTRISLREARKAKKLTQAALAKKLHRDQSFVSRAERGAAGITLEDAKTIGEVLGVDPLALVFTVPKRQAVA